MRHLRKARAGMVIVAVACLTLCSPALWLHGGTALAQNPDGRLVVTVKDQSDAVISGATVTVTNNQTTVSVSTPSNSSGIATFPQLEPGDYTVTVEAANFQQSVFEAVKIDVGRDYSLIAELAVGAPTEVVTITAGENIVTTTNAELTTTVTPKQVRDLPLDGRNPLQLIQLQAGVTSTNGRGGVTINGQRTSTSTITQDGITVQDYAIRTNALTFSPNRTTVSQVSEFAVTTQNGGADTSGASAIRIVTPSGGNELHGEVYEYHRNDALGANEFFNNANDIEKPQLIRNQFGFAVSGPVFIPNVYDGRNKFFWFGSYEGFRERTATPTTTTVLTPAARMGIFQYEDINGGIRSINVLAARNIGVDPTISSLLGQIPLPNSDLAGDQLVTSGFTFNQLAPTNRNQGTTRLDYVLNDRHKFEAVYQYTGELNRRPDIDTSFQVLPVVFDDTQTHRAVAAWNWNITDVLTNELRVGLNNSSGGFRSEQDTSLGYFVIFPLTSDPQVAFDPQFRRTIVSSLIDDASYIWGDHFFRFGFRTDQISLRNVKSFTLTPQVTIGLSTAAPGNLAFRLGDLPGGTSADVANANALLATLGGFISGASREFNVASTDNPVFQPVQQLLNNELDQYALYVQDQWRVHPRVTLNLGLRWDYFTPLREEDNLALLPTGPGGVASILDPNGSVDFVDGFYYNPDRNNFAPQIGVAWDVFGDGLTTVRGGFSVAFVNDEAVRTVQVLGETNPGLTTTLATGSTFGILSQDVNQILNGALAPPPVQIPLTFAEILNQNPAAFTTGVNRDLETPYYQQWNVAVEREVGWDTAVALRYVGTRGRKLVGNINYNQVDVIGTGFADDVARARQNGFLALDATGVFNPAFNPNIPGSQPLTVFPNIAFGGVLSAGIVQQFIQQGRAGDLADLYVANGLAGTVPFVPNPNAYFAIVLDNTAYSSYNAFQAEVRRRFSKSLGFQANYTFSKALGFGAGTGQLRQDFPEDLADIERDERRLLFDATHNFKANFLYDLPFGDGQLFDPDNGILERLVGGWQIGSIFQWYTGAPISIFTGRGTFTPGGGQVFSTLTSDEIKDLFGIFHTEDGIFYINPSVIGPDGRAVAADGQPPFAGQVFFNPGPGQKGALQNLQFSGPSVFNWDASLIKRTAITETVNAEFRAEFFNVLNHPIFFLTSQDVNSVNFGQLTQTLNSARVVQLAVKINF